MDPNNVPTGSPLYIIIILIPFMSGRTDRHSQVNISRLPSFDPVHCRSKLSSGGSDNDHDEGASPSRARRCRKPSIRPWPGSRDVSEWNRDIIVYYIYFSLSYLIYIYIYSLYSVYMIWCMLCIASILRFLLFAWMYRYLRVLCRINNCEIIKV